MNGMEDNYLKKIIDINGVVRSVDGLGRVVIPIELRKKLGMNENEPVEILSVEVEDLGEGIFIRKYHEPEND